MKTRAIAAFIIAGSLSFTACSIKMDEKTMSEITQFGTEWTALGEQASTWSQQLSETAAQATEFSTKQAEMINTFAVRKCVDHFRLFCLIFSGPRN